MCSQSYRTELWKVLTIVIQIHTKESCFSFIFKQADNISVSSKGLSSVLIVKFVIVNKI